ncbi:hypothetical protein, partial [Geobacillus thermoleovorans]|uniref:hypothetical protein n=2 Tax=Anoxybacillaceae TaxID=3120669 RepID=UPI001A980DCF
MKVQPTIKKEGYHHERQWHYKVYVVTDIPKDLDIEEVCLTLKETFLPTVYPYRFLRCDYSTKYEGWVNKHTFHIPIGLYVIIS